MDFYDSRYFLWNKNMQIFLGVWPYQNRFRSRIICLVFLFSLTLATVPHVIALHKYAGVDLNRTIFAITLLIYIAGDLVKIVVFNALENRFRRVYERLARSYDSFMDKEERKILESHFEIGRILTLGYVGFIITALIAFDTLPCCCHIIKSVMSTNGTCQYLYILDGEYFIDNKDDYFVLIYSFEIFCTLVTVPIFCTFDSTYTVCVQHCIGLFDVIKFRLQLSSNTTNEPFDLNHSDKSPSCRMVIKSIKLHQEVYDLYEELESVHSTTFLIILGIMIVSICTAGLIFTENLSNPYEAIRYGMVTFGMIMHLFYMMYPGQKLLDHSSSIVFDAYNSEWYECSTETKRLLLFMMRRCLKPFKLTAGRMYVLNIENFAKLIKCSLSYFMVFSSIRRI